MSMGIPRSARDANRSFEKQRGRATELCRKWLEEELKLDPRAKLQRLKENAYVEKRLQEQEAKRCRKLDTEQFIQSMADGMHVVACRLNRAPPMDFIRLWLGRENAHREQQRCSRTYDFTTDVFRVGFGIRRCCIFVLASTGPGEAPTETSRENRYMSLEDLFRKRKENKKARITQ
jgi:hypothetical protein